jgi:hypothetical protein
VGHRQEAVLQSGFGGLLSVGGQATLAGQAALPQADIPPGADSPLITFGSLSGNFTSHALGMKLRTRANEIDALTVPQIAASPATVPPGGKLTVNGASFGVGAAIFLDHATGTPLATAPSSDSGRFSVPVTIPASAAPGQHTLIAVGPDGSRATTRISVS